MKFADIPQMTRDGSYVIDIHWKYIETWLHDQDKDIGIDLDPDFQRAHVWSEEKQRAYVEFSLRGGRGSGLFRFNCAGWQLNFDGPFVIVDGKQRLEAVRKFMRNELAIFGGHFFKDFTDDIRMVRTECKFMINDLKTRAEVLQWYLDINTGGVVHTETELRKVRDLLAKEQAGNFS